MRADVLRCEYGEYYSSFLTYFLEDRRMLQIAMTQILDFHIEDTFAKNMKRIATSILLRHKNTYLLTDLSPVTIWTVRKMCTGLVSV